MLPKRLGYWLIVAIFLIQAIILAGLFAKHVFDPRFETYQNYFFLTAMLAVLVRAYHSSVGRRVFFLSVAPLLWGNTFFIAIAITIIIEFNQDVYLKTTFFNGGTNTISIIHSFDWILHQLPFFFVVIILWANFIRYRKYFLEFWIALDSVHQVIYSLYFLTCAAVWQLLYMTSFPFAVNYPVPLPTWSVTLTVIATCILINSFLFVALIHNNIPKHNKKKSKLT